MSIKILFVIPATCKSEQECSKVMLESYSAAVIYELDTKWINETDSNIETGKTDFIIFEKFEGPFYTKVLHSKSVRILSPLCLLQCIEQAKPIPNSDTPLVSLALENCIVVCSCLPKDCKRDLKWKVQAMAGLFSGKLVSDTTYLITDGVKSEKFNVAVTMGIKIMSVEFIDALWEASKTRGIHASHDEFQKFTCPVFLNLNICSTGFSKDEIQVQKLVEQHGGRFSSAMDVSKTDILVCKSSTSTTSAKYKTAMKKNIDCVTEDWILDSVKKGYALPNVKDYAVKAATSTPTKNEAFVDPNFSQMSMIIKPTSSQAVSPKLIEQTMNNSNFLVATKRKSPATAFDSVIDNIDIKRAKTCGLFLDGCVIFVAGFKTEQKEKLCKILNFSGAVPCFSLNDRITHAIIGNPKCHEFKQITSKNLPCAIVDVKWLVDSMNEQMPVDVDKYLITSENCTQQSNTSGNNSPLSKKGLSFLRADVTILESHPEKVDNPPPVETNDQDDEVLQRYMNSMQGSNSVDDALAAFTLNPQPNQTNKTSADKHNSCTPNPKTSDAFKANASSPSISITIEESMAPIFSNLKFIVLNYTEEEEESMVEQIKEMQGTVVGKNFKGIPDYAIVPINNQSLQHTATNIVTFLWLSECLEQKCLLTELEYYHRPFPSTSDALKGLCITFSGLGRYEKEFLSHIIDQHGGVQQDWMSRNAIPAKNTLATTHLISNEPSGKKYEGALKWGLPVVHKEWLLKCVEERKRVNEEEYILRKDKGIDASVTVSTPVRKRTTEVPEVCATPPNMGMGPCSQITPVNEIMARVRKMCGGMVTPGGQAGTPETPDGNNSRMDIATPDTPYGAIFQNPPPADVRKKWKRWVMNMPSPKASQSTPLSEIKRQFWSKYNSSHSSRESQSGDLRKEFPSLFSQNENRAPPAEQSEPMAIDPPYNDTENAMNDLVLGQIDVLESHMMSTAGNSVRRSSVRKMENEGGKIPEKESQPMTVGWDEYMVIPSAPKHKHFMISGVDVEERASLVKEIEELGGTVSSLNNFDPSATHLLCHKLNRNEKLLASMASGLWILHISYATDSYAAKKLLNEEDYEFGNPKAMHKFKLDSDAQQKATAARYWREEIGRRGYGAFHDIRAIVLANRKEPMIRVLQAGGAMIVDASPPFEENVSATHCFLEVKNNELSPFITLAQQGILCINTLYVNDFLQRTAQDINDFILPGFRKYY
ncbi:DNA topoisomerase 2-binding protein 1 isoform X3 [Atheta coriaria]|uniref:DNA topoisomerase 2-binding protein 1 isoform X3 n=1 Tax=Dalotia coriaria TaxID=877792 RepID=UPI0031F417D4